MDYRRRPSAAGLPCAVNDIIIVKNDVVMGPDEIGEIWMSAFIFFSCIDRRDVLMNLWTVIAAVQML